MRNIIEIKHLSKSFGDVKAVQDISFCVKEGELFAFLGVNGAGKSTVMGMISRLIAKDAGVIQFEDEDLSKWKSKDPHTGMCETHKRRCGFRCEMF